MCEQALVEYCSPTMAGMKTGSLFNSRFESREDLYGEITRINLRLRGKGIVMLPLRLHEGRALVYVYRPQQLSADLSQAELQTLLQSYGYDTANFNACICKLIERLRTCEEFPHEIGAFLGYPAADVIGFIEHRARDEKYTGYWKVYSNVESSRKLFDKYSKCTRIYREQYAKGATIEKLSVGTV